MLIRAYAVNGLVVCKRDGSSSTALRLKEQSVTFDSTWAPFAQMSLTVVNPGAAVLAAIDPRTGLRVRATMTQDDLAGTVYSKPFDLMLRSRSVDWASGTAVLQATSDEAALMDWAMGSYGTAGYPDNSGGITEAATRAGYAQASSLPAASGTFVRHTDAPLIQTNPSGNVPTPQDAEDMWAPGVTAWDYASQLAQLSGAYLFGDEVGALHMAPRGYAMDTTAIAFGDGNIINVQDAVSREDPNWANYAVVTFQPPQGASSTVAAVVSSDGTITPRKSINQVQNRKKPTNGNAATPVRLAAQKRGRTLTVDSVLDIRTRPNTTVSATYQGQTFNGSVRAVTMNLPAGTMNTTIDVFE